MLSPGTQRTDRTLKVPLYREYGVSHLWLVDPLAQAVEVLRVHVEVICWWGPSSATHRHAWNRSTPSNSTWRRCGSVEPSHRLDTRRRSGRQPNEDAGADCRATRTSPSAFAGRCDAADGAAVGEHLQKRLLFLGECPELLALLPEALGFGVLFGVEHGPAGQRG